MIQFLIGAFLVGIGVFLLHLIFLPEVKPGVDVASVIRGLKVAAMIIGPMALLTLIGGVLLLTNKRRGWWLALVADFMLMGVFIYSMMDEGWTNVDWAMAGVTTMSVILPVLLLLLKVRKFYWLFSQCLTPAIIVSEDRLKLIRVSP